MNKVVRDGKVAVLVSPGYGAGWSTWNSGKDCLYSPEIVGMVESGASHEDINEKANELWPDGYWGGARDLVIEWVEQGEAFEISEYDGSESLRVIGNCDFEIA